MDGQERGRVGLSNFGSWPHYAGIALGLPNYWYPATWSKRVGRRPLRIELLGEAIMLRREAGKVYALGDICPHRGVPLSMGRQEFPGTWSCVYHGWTFDLETGIVRAALTDGPQSAVCGRVRVRTYPIAERAGIVFLWMGKGPPVPVEDDMPDEFLRPDSVIVGRLTIRQGNWRYAAENSVDEGHAAFLHRYHSLWTKFTRMAGWIVSLQGGDRRGDWVVRTADEIGGVGEFPGLGRWPKFRFWNRAPGRVTVSYRLPGNIRVAYGRYNHYNWYMPLDRERHHYFQFLVAQGNWLQRQVFRLRYWLYRRWLFHVRLNNQDSRMVRLMPETEPAPLYRPDASIAAWRRLCEEARGETV
jgi:phenylpropionate dioxygenase-like ring-hydroxylating dioxygenase large terminal subunit